MFGNFNHTPSNIDQAEFARPKKVQPSARKLYVWQEEQVI